jgi:hypothetical protein
MRATGYRCPECRKNLRTCEYRRKKPPLTSARAFVCALLTAGPTRLAKPLLETAPSSPGSHAKSAVSYPYGRLSYARVTRNSRTIRGIAPGGTRTPNPQLRRLMLYPIKLQARNQHHCSWPAPACQPSREIPHRGRRRPRITHRLPIALERFLQPDGYGRLKRNPNRDRFAGT